MHNKTVIEFGFCDISALSTLIIPHIIKTSSNNSLLLYMNVIFVSFNITFIILNIFILIRAFGYKTIAFDG